MATPHVAGVAAVMLSLNDMLTVLELKELLMNYGDPVPALDGICVSGRRLNAYSSLDEVAPPGPTFRLSANPPTRQTINQGQDATYPINIESVSEFSNPVNLSASSNPPINASITFNPDSGIPGFSSEMRVFNTTPTNPGDYIITVTGVSDGITKTTTVTLTVKPEGLITESYSSNDTPIPIPDCTFPCEPPDNYRVIITSTINVPDSLTIWNTTCEVHITHTWKGDLIVKLISPAGTYVILHSKEGGSDNNINETYVLPTEFRNQNSAGNWTLEVSDNMWADVGTLDSWTLTIGGIPTGGPVNQAPTVEITAPTDGATFTQGDSINFTATATDPEDNNSSLFIQWTSSIDPDFDETGASVTTDALSAGIHIITAEATDSGDKSGRDSITVTVNPSVGVKNPLLTGEYAGKGKNKGFQTTDLFAPGDEVVIHASVIDANGEPIANALVDIAIAGFEDHNLTSEPSDNNGIAEAKWKTSAPTRPKGKGKKGGTSSLATTTGSYTATVTNVDAGGYTWDGIRTNTSFTLQ
jgi:subtilisin-like proprotein convertase family protein